MTTKEIQTDLFNDKQNPSAIIDEFAELYNKLQPELDRLKKLQEKVGKYAAEAGKDSDDPVTLVGYRFSVDYSAPTQEALCRLDAQKFILTTGKWAAVKVAVTEARKVLSPEEFEDLFENSKGSRRLKRVRVTS